MRSIKPGRGPSILSGIVGIFMIFIGIAWTALAAQASGFFAIFGVMWTAGVVAITIYNFKNATGKNRHSAFDITENGEEPDPLNERFGDCNGTDPTPSHSSENRFCPYCGTPVKGDFEFCNKCGRKLP